MKNKSLTFLFLPLMLLGCSNIQGDPITAENFKKAMDIRSCEHYVMGYEKTENNQAQSYSITRDGNLMKKWNISGDVHETTYYETIGESHYIYTQNSEGKWTKQVDSSNEYKKCDLDALNIISLFKYDSLEWKGKYYEAKDGKIQLLGNTIIGVKLRFEKDRIAEIKCISTVISSSKIQILYNLNFSYSGYEEVVLPEVTPII